MISYLSQIIYMCESSQELKLVTMLQDIMQHKLVFIETPDVVETTLALDNYRKACDCGRGAVFFSVARLVRNVSFSNQKVLFKIRCLFMFNFSLVTM